MKLTDYWWEEQDFHYRDEEGKHIVLKNCTFSHIQEEKSEVRDKDGNIIATIEPVKLIFRPIE